jgi:glycosyltransferase involved in cell wall biosynthesis
MILGIEASNILAGGGLRHLKEMLSHAEPRRHGFDRVVVWAPQTTLDQLKDQYWLDKQTHAWLNKSIFFRMLWQFLILPTHLKKEMDVVFTPGANAIPFSKVVSMCQNLLPFDREERKLYWFSWIYVRLKILQHAQIRSFQKAQRVIFLTPSSIHYVKDVYFNIESKATVIPHGISNVFFQKKIPKDPNQPIRLLYTSIIDLYKHQWNVVQAVFNLLDQGCNIELQLVGSAYGPAMKKLNNVLMSKPEYQHRIQYTADVPFDVLTSIYRESDIFVFASSCETFSLILLEAMASGLPIACSDRDTLRDTLQDTGLYFNPYDVKNIEGVLIELIRNEELRDKLSQAARQKAEAYSWSTCADLTFASLSEVGLASMHKKK